MTVCLAVDAGGTSTRALLIAADGTCVGYGRAGGGNPVSWGREAAARSVAAAVTAAVAQARGQRGVPGVGSVELAGPAVLAMAGSSAAPATQGWAETLANAGVRGSVVFESDLLATFCAGTPEREGYAVVAGTGASAIRVVDGGVQGTVDGLGWLLGDGGSGFWIGHRAVRAALADLDGRGPATAVSGLLLAALGVPRDRHTGGDGRPEELRRAVDALYALRPVELARFAAVVLAAAADGDVTAAAILDEARRRLVRSLSAAYLPGHAGPVVLGGGIARRLPGLAAAVDDEVRSWPADRGMAAGARAGAPVVIAAGARADARRVAPVVVIVEDGAVGAGVLALRHAGVAVDQSVFDRLTASVAGFRASAAG